MDNETTCTEETTVISLADAMRCREVRFLVECVLESASIDNNVALAILPFRAFLGKEKAK